MTNTSGTRISRRQLFVAGTAAAALTATGCGAGASSSGAPTPTSTVPGRFAQPLVVAQTSGQKAETIASFARLDDHPLFSVTWKGKPAEVVPESATDAAAMPTGYACTLFAASDPQGKPLIGRNFDWDPAPASVVESTLDNGRKSLSVTDLRYAGFNSTQDLNDKKKREGLTRVHAIAFDGMNSEGLFIGLAADYSEAAKPPIKDGRDWVGGVSIQRIILDTVDTVNQAIEVFNKYNIDFSGGPALHYLIADKSGAKAIVEFDAEKLVVIRPPDGQPWLCLENFHMSGTSEEEQAKNSRFNTCSTTLKAANGKISVDETVTLLNKVRQSHTQWQSVYRLTDGKVRVIGTKAHEFSL